MSGLRDRLERRGRRRRSILVQVADTSELDQLIAADRVQLVAAENAGEKQRAQELRAQWQAHTDERTTACFAQLELRALSSADWEALVASHPGGEDDYCDWAAVLPLAMAESCTDPELQDEQWWTGHLGSDLWTAGDKQTLKATLLDLNLRMLPVAEVAGKD